MSNEKACAQVLVEEAEKKLAALITDLSSNLHDSRSKHLTPGEETASAAQAALLDTSNVTWREYRDETCEMVYYRYYPGSMARLEKLNCLRQLTEKRIEQLQDIFSSDYDKVLEF